MHNGALLHQQFLVCR